MELNIKTAKASTTSDEESWGGSIADDGLFILLEVKGSSKNPASVVGNKILEEIISLPDEDKVRSFEALLELLRKYKDDKSITTIIIGFLDSNNLYLGNLGKGLVYLKRGDKIGKILSCQEVSKGVLKDNDLLIFCSEKFNQLFSNTVKSKLFHSHNPDKIIEEVIPSLLDKTDLKGATFLTVLVNTKNGERKSSFTLDNINQKGKGALSDIRKKADRLLIKKPRRLLEDPKELKSKKTLLTISVVLVFLLVVSIFFNIGYNKSFASKQKLNEAINLVTHQYDEAIGLIDLNPIRARELLTSSKMSLSPLLSSFPKKSDEYKLVKEWLEKISSAEVAAYKIYQYTSIPVFFDISLVKSDGSADQVASYQEEKAVLDIRNKVVYYLKSDTKESGIIAGSEVVKNASTISIHGGKVYILNSDGIVSIDVSSKTSKVVVGKDEKWGNITALTAFGGNLYLLDTTNNIVWKYIATESGLSSRYSYFNPDVKVDLNSADEMVIDGSVWINSNKQNILKFTRGLQDQFDFKGLADIIEEISAISTSDVDENIYVLDKKASRILVFDKDGVYQSQYQWSELAKARDFVVSEREGKIFVFIQGKVYGIDLK